MLNMKNFITLFLISIFIFAVASASFTGGYFIKKFKSDKYISELNDKIVLLNSEIKEQKKTTK